MPSSLLNIIRPSTHHGSWCSGRAAAAGGRWRSGQCCLVDGVDEIEGRPTDGRKVAGRKVV